MRNSGRDVGKADLHPRTKAANKLTLMTKFHEYKMVSNDSVAQHVTKIENMVRQLKDDGEELSEVMIILGTLSQRFNSSSLRTE